MSAYAGTNHLPVSRGCSGSSQGVPATQKLVYEPLTPPSTDERRTNGAISRLLRTLRETDHRSSLPGFTGIDPKSYILLRETLDRDVRRHDYEPRLKRVTVRMPSQVHDFYSSELITFVRASTRVDTHLGHIEPCIGS